MPSILEVSEGIQEISRLDTGAWGVDVAKIAASPAAPTLVRVLDESADSDVKATVMPTGAPSFSGSIMAWPAWAALSGFEGKILRVEFSFSDDGGVVRGRYARFKVIF